ncbi:MAG: hypothetical protein ACOCRK_06870 [bacterium]
MKNVFWLIIILFLSSCNYSTEKEGTIHKEKDVTSNEKEINTESKKEYDFFGTWEFTNTLPGDISALSQEEIDKLIGKRIEFSNNTAFYENSIQVYYEIKDIPITKFRDKFKIQDDWGINPEKKTIHEIIIYKNNSKKEVLEWDHEGFGVDIYYVDSRLIMNIGGVFFELNRVVNENIEGGEQEVDTDFNYDDLYGTWEATQMLMGEKNELTDSYKFIFMKDFCDYKKNRGLNQPYYNYERISKEEFEEEYNIDLDKYNINHDLIKVKIYEDDTMKEEWKTYEGTFYLVEDYRMIMCARGNIYNLEKTSDEKVNNYIINRETIKEGTEICGLTASNVDRSEFSYMNIEFEGELELTGVYEWIEWDGLKLAVEIDYNNSINRIPVFEYSTGETLYLENAEQFKNKLEKKTGKVTIIINNYSIGDREIACSADLVEVIEKEE